MSIGELLTYRITITNVGNANATTVRLTNLFGTNVSFFSASVSQGSFTTNASNLVASFGTISSGASVRADVIVTPWRTGQITNVARLALSESDATPANNVATQATAVAGLTLRAGPNLGVPRAYHTATLLQNGRVLVAGGANATGTLAHAELFDPTTRTFLPAGNMREARSGHSATLLNDGKVLIAGGYPGGFTAELYDPATNGFSTVSNMNSGHIHHTATLLADGRVLIAGSYYSYPMTSAEIYVPSLRRFTNAASMSGGATFHRALLLTNNKVLIAGGVGWYGFDLPANGNIYDSTNNAFSDIGPLNFSRLAPGMAQLSDGRVLVAGGNYAPFTADMFNPATQTFVTLSNQMRGRHHFAAAHSLPNNKVFIAGYSKENDLFNPANNSFERSVDMLTARSWFASTLLQDGSVLITGGNISGAAPYFDSTEIFEPAMSKTPPLISIGNASIVEGNNGTTNFANFIVTLSAPMGIPVSVDFTTYERSALLDKDFVSTTGRLVFPPGVITQFVTVPIIGDINHEQDETFVVGLLDATNALIDVAEGVGTIVNDDTLPAISIAASPVREMNGGITNAVVNLRLSAYRYQIVQVDFATANGSAIAGSDYIATNGVIGFDYGVTNISFTVQIKGDTQIEPDETFLVQLSNPVNATLANTSAVATILDDDGPGWPHHFAISLPPGAIYATQPIPFTIRAKDVNDNDTTNFNGRLLLSVGRSDEDPQRFRFSSGTLDGWTPLNTGRTPGPYEVTLLDVDGDGDASFAFRTAADVGQDGIARGVPLLSGRQYYVIGDFAQSDIDGAPNGGNTVAHLILGGTELANYSFGEIYPNQIQRATLAGTFYAPFTSSFDLRLTFNRDPWYEAYYIGAHADDVVVSAAPILPRWTGQFTNGVWAGTNAIPISGSNFVLFAEDEEGHFGTRPLTIDAVTDLSLTQSISTNPHVGADLVTTFTVLNRGPGTVLNAVLTNPLPPGPLFVSATASSGSCTVSNGIVVCSLGMMQPNQSATVAVMLRPSATGMISSIAGAWPSGFDNGPTNNVVATNITIAAPQIAISGSAVTEFAGGTTNAVFVVTVGLPHDDPVTVDFATSDSSAVAGFDYVATAGQLTFAPGVGTQTVSVVVLDDSIPEFTESFRVQLTNPVNASLAAAAGFGTIFDNGDPKPLISISDVILFEGDAGTTNAVFAIQLDRPAGYFISITYATSNGTAVAGSDFIATNGSVGIQSGATSGAVVVRVRGNTVNEPDESFSVRLALGRDNGNGGTLVRTQAVCTILNDDAVPGRLDHFDWTVGQPRVAGRQIPVTLTARDAFNNVVTNDPGLVAITASGTLKNFVVTPTQAWPFANGVWTGAIIASSANSNVVLRADDGSEHIGLSAAFDILPPIAMTLGLPSGANENAGILSNAGSLTTAAPLSESVLFNLTSTDTTELNVPTSVLLPAGQTNVTFDLIPVDDPQLDGTRIVGVVATLPDTFPPRTRFRYTTMNAPRWASVQISLSRKAPTPSPDSSRSVRRRLKQWGLC